MRLYPQDQAETLGDIDLDLHRMKIEGAHPDAPRAMSVVPRVSIPSRTSALELGGRRGGGYWPTGLLASHGRQEGDILPRTTHWDPTPPPLPPPRVPSSLLSLRSRSSFVFFPTTHRPLSFRSSVAALQTTLASLFLLLFLPASLLPRPRRARPASFIRRKIHLHNGPHAHRLLTRSIRIVYTPSWKLTSSTTTRTYVNNMYI